MQVFSTQPAALYTGVGNAFLKISSTEGIRALWRGVASVIVGAGPAHAVYFGTYEAVKEMAGGNRAGHQFIATCTFCSVGQISEGLVYLSDLHIADSACWCLCDHHERRTDEPL